MSTLRLLFSSRVKAETFRLLFGLQNEELHVREMARRARLNDATVRQELKRLANLGLVLVRRDGNRSYYRANGEHPLYPDIRGLVLKTDGLADILRAALGDRGIEQAFVFGSLASGTEKPGSDLDLMVVGSIGFRALSARLRRVAAQLGREINPVVFSTAEFAKRKQSGDHFLATVLKAPKLFLIGDERELERLGE
jgi:predicted nucleotidyltransferase